MGSGMWYVCVCELSVVKMGSNLFSKDRLPYHIQNKFNFRRCGGHLDIQTVLLCVPARHTLHTWTVCNASDTQVLPQYTYSNMHRHIDDA